VLGPFGFSVFSRLEKSSADAGTTSSDAERGHW